MYKCVATSPARYYIEPYQAITRAWEVRESIFIVMWRLVFPPVNVTAVINCGGGGGGVIIQHRPSRDLPKDCTCTLYISHQHQLQLKLREPYFPPNTELTSEKAVTPTKSTTPPPKTAPRFEQSHQQRPESIYIHTLKTNRTVIEIIARV